MEHDNTPTIDEFRPAVLKVLSEGQVYPLRRICDLAADALGLSAEVRAERISSGQERYVNRAQWACSSLTKAGLLERPQRGHYRITSDGVTLARRDLTSYSEKDMREWPAWRSYLDEIAIRQSQSPAEVDTDVSAQDPLELLAAGESAYNAQTETDLRKRLQDASPEFFEKAVIDVLWAMGYGGAHGEKQHVGRSGDGGIDGIIRQDALGLSNVYVQAKRYSDTNKVGTPEIRNFIGALDSRGATLGVFITTSDFQPAARRAADSYRHGRIVLINGIMLTSLMLSYGVGVHKAREFTLYEMDDDYFSSDIV